MEYFKTKASEKWHKVNDISFENATGNNPPYVMKNRDGKDSYFAICPLCDNPVQLIGLFKKDNNEIRPYGKHCIASVSGFADYNADEVEFCPFFSGTKYKGNVLVKSSDRTNKLYKLFLEHPDAIYHVFSLSTGIIVSLGLVRKTLPSWFADEKWLFYAANKATLPYVLFYAMPSFRLYGRVVRENSELYLFLKSIQKKYCLKFEKNADNGCVQVKTENKVKCPLHFVIQNYHCSKDWKQSFNLAISDTSLPEDKSIIKKIKIPVDGLILDNLIGRGYSNQQVKDIVSDFVK